jgi:hypothetical protein
VAISGFGANLPLMDSKKISPEVSGWIRTSRMESDGELEPYFFNLDTLSLRPLVTKPDRDEQGP